MSFRITILGSSGALPAYGRHPSCQLVEIQNRYFLIDCGEAAQMQLMKYQLSIHRIQHIFISHLHGDHYLGLMGLLFTMHLQNRQADLHLYSHRGLDEIIVTQLRYSRSVLAFKIIYHFLEKGVQEVIYEDDALQVETIPLDHKIRCSGFMFREKPKPRRINKDLLPEGFKIADIVALKRGEDLRDEDGNIVHTNHSLTIEPRKSRTYAYCSDTAYLQDVVPQIMRVDVLYHEATFTEDEKEKAQETRHSTAAQAAMIAREAQADQLLLGHFSARYKDPAPLLQEAKNIFPRVKLAIEGEEISIPE